MTGAHRKVARLGVRGRVYALGGIAAVGLAGVALLAVPAFAEAARSPEHIGVIQVRFLILAPFAAACMLAATVLTMRSIASGLKRSAEGLEALAGKDLSVRLANEGDDELGRMAGALNRAGVVLGESVSVLGQNAEVLTTSSEELAAVSKRLSTDADETSNQAHHVSTAASQVCANVNTVATGIEEMSASIKEVAKNAHDAAKVATAAVKVTETTHLTMEKLGESSSEIGNVIKVITSIAEQTNLLSLNATIEAARAGEAGKGFAVVANEVKELAKETGKATEEISEKVAAIQADARGAVAAIREISKIIAQINDIQNAIASSVEEQTVTTSEIGRNAAEAAFGSNQIAQSILCLAETAKSTTAGASNTRKAAVELARLSSELTKVISQFKL